MNQWRPQATGNPTMDENLRQITQQISELQSKTKNLAGVTSGASGSSVVAAVLNQPLPSLSMTANVAINVGNGIRIPSAGTYFFMLNVQASSAATASLSCFAKQNSVQIGTVFTIALANNNSSTVSFYLIPAQTNDVLQLVVTPTVTAAYFFTIQTALLRQI